MRILVFILLMLGTVCSASAQSDTSYHLLWYKGKKIKPNVLLTPGGDSVTYSPQKASIKVVSKSSNGNKLDKMLAELNRNNKRLSETIQKISASIPTKKLLPFYSIQVKKAYDQIKSDYTGPLSNTLIIPAIAIPGLQAGTGKGGNSSNPEDVEKIFDDYVAELKVYMLQHKDETITWVPTPPRYDYSYCYPCDEERQKQYERDFEAFRTELAGTDYNILQKALNASRQANFLLSESKNNQIQNELRKAIDFIWVRMEKRAIVLVEKYLDDPFRVHAVLQIALATDRVNQLMEPEGTKGLDASNYLERGAMTVARYFEKAVDENDYSVGLNLSGIFGVDRMLQLMGSYAPVDIMSKVLKFNQFKLNVHVSAKLGNDNGFAMAEVNGDNWFYAIPDSSCRLFWFLVGPYMNKMKIDLLETAWRGNGGEIPYVGTKNWNTDIPSFRVDFCHDKTDSITFYSFYPEGFKELWQFPSPWGAKDVSTISGVYLTCFLNVERTKEDYAKFKDPANVEKMKKEMIAQYQQMMKNNRSNTIARGPDENYDLTRLSQWADMQKSSRQFSETIHSNGIGRILFQPEVHNKKTLIIQDKINGKDLFPQNGAIEYAWYHIKLEHDPDGPYRVHWGWSHSK